MEFSEVCDALRSSVAAGDKAVRAYGYRKVVAKWKEYYGENPLVKTIDTDRYTLWNYVHGRYIYKGKRGFLEHIDDKVLWGPYAYDRTNLIYSTDEGYYDLAIIIHYFHECECGSGLIVNEDNCHRCREVLHPYSTQVETILETEATKDILTGVEMEYNEMTVGQVNPYIKGHALCKSDGSVRRGLEIVTRPASTSCHKKSLKSLFDKCKLSKADNTGMHVHVDRKAFSEFTLGFIMEFVNSEKLIPYITKVAGRDYADNIYSSRQDHKMTWGLREDGKKLTRDDTSRYCPVNTAKRKTVEFRIFASPETHEEMCARLDFVKGLVKYASPYSVSVKSLRDKFSWDVFTSYMKANKKDYPDFYNLHLKG